MPSVTRTLAVDAASAWSALVDVRAWPRWGPSVTGATIDGGGWRIAAGATGRVRTLAGVSVPFAITEFEEARRWAWRVAGIPATAHEVVPLEPGRCRATMTVPRWAPLYLPVCWEGLRRLDRVAATPPAGRGR